MLLHLGKHFYFYRTLNPIQMKYKCIIFDCDGVLVDSEYISNSVVTEMANELGVSISKEYALKYFSGKSLKFIFDHIENALGEKLPEDFEVQFRKKTFDAFTKDLKPIEGIHNLLSRIDIPFCVASNGPLEKTKLNLTVTNLIQYFEGKMFSAYEIGSWKPNPELYLYAAKSMGFEVHECIVVEDSISGVMAAKAGGFDVIGFVNDNNHESFQKENIPLCYDMNDLNCFLN
jgi:HAD superfamily hydrolase (TIGR01509 family)